MMKQILLIAVLSLFTLPVLAATKSFTTPFYSLALDASMQDETYKHPKQDREKTIDGVKTQFYYYLMTNSDKKIALEVEVLTSAAFDASDRDFMQSVQSQFIAGVVRGMNRRLSLGAGNNIHNITNKDIKKVKLNNREFAKVTYEIPSKVLMVFSTINQNKLYVFVIMSKDKTNEHNDARVIEQQIAQINFR